MKCLKLNTQIRILEYKQCKDNMKTCLLAIKNFFIHFLRRILQIAGSLLLFITCAVIYLVTLEPGTSKRATARKARRIKTLTKVKLYAYKWFKSYWEFTHNIYLEQLYNNFHFLIEK